MKKEKKVLVISGFALFFIVTVTVFASSSKQQKFKSEQEREAKAIEREIQDSIAKQEKIAQEYQKDSLEQSKIVSYSVNKISGSHKYGGITKIQYQNFVQLMKDELEEAKKQMKPDSEVQEIVSLIKSDCAGRIRLDVTRNTIGSANLEYFTIIVKDKNDKEIYRKELEDEIPNPSYGSDDWWNIGIESIPNMKNQEFYVYIVDELDDAVHKFKVTPRL